MTNPFDRAIKEHAGKDPSQDEQEKLGKPRKDDFDDNHAQFLQTILGLIDAGTIDTKHPKSFIHEDVYADLSDELRSRTDQAIPNIVSLLERIMDLHAREEGNESFEMKSLIETLWQSKQRIEEEADVFVF